MSQIRDTGESLSNSLNDTRILLVEDNPSVRVSVADMLQTVGAKVHGVGTGAEALACLKVQSFDIVFTDLGLPDMDGGELTARIREAYDLPIVLMSGWPRKSIMKQLEGNPQPNAILPKPTPVQDMISTIQQCTRPKPVSSKHVVN